MQLLRHHYGVRALLTRPVAIKQSLGGRAILEFNSFGPPAKSLERAQIDAELLMRMLKLVRTICLHVDNAYAPKPVMLS